MPRTMQELGIDQISIEERLALAQEIWDSVAEELEREPLTPAQRQELERRLTENIARPDAVTPWEEVKVRALARARR
jgi:putative addiction module component (TIGR02574 family)